MNTILLLTTLLSVGNQDKCYQGNIIIESEAALEMYQSSNSYECIAGNLHIKNIQMNNLNAFSNLTVLKGDLVLEGVTGLKNVEGLSNLKSIGQDLRLDNLHNFKNLNGFSSLRSIGNAITISNNPQLENIDGLKFVGPAIREIHIHDNSSLQNLNGLSGISLVTGDLKIVNNSNLEDFDGLTQEMEVDGRQIIKNNKNEFDTLPKNKNETKYQSQPKYYDKLAMSFGPDIGYTNLGNGNVILGGEFTIMPAMKNFVGMLGFGFSYLYNFESDKNLIGLFSQFSLGVFGVEAGYTHEFATQGAGPGFKIGLFSSFLALATYYLHPKFPIPIPYCRVSFFGEGDIRIEGGLLLKIYFGKIYTIHKM